MDPERWEVVQSLFAEALGRPPASRRAWLVDRCHEDPGLAAEVASLLEADERMSAGDGDAVRGTHARYRLHDRLGEGGTSVVYLATVEADRDRRTPSGTDGPAAGAAVAVKVLSGHADLRLVERFAVELEVLSRLDHPSIARLVDAGTTEDGRPFVVTRLVEGEPIDRHCARSDLPIADRLRLFVAVCEAVSVAHRALVIHRDLKPGNILVTADGRPVLLDFGLARLFRSPAALEQGAQATETGGRMLTLSCASPEQIRGEPLTTASDVYGLGVLLHQLLVGAAPFVAWHDRPAELARAICEVDPDPPSRAVLERGTIERPEAWSRRLRGDLDAIVGQALSKRPSRRYGSVESLAQDVRRHLDGRPVRARPAGFAYRMGKLLRRHRLAVATSTALAAGLVVASATAVVQERRMADERDRAQRSFELLVDMLRTADPSLGGAVTAREILDQAASRVDEELSDQPDLQARLLDAVGTIYLAIGAIEAADSPLTRALELHRAAHGEEPSRQAAAILEHLGALRQEQGQHAEAEALFRSSLAQRRALLGAGDPLVAAGLSNLADALRDQASYDRAEPLYRQALAIYRSRLGPQDAEVAKTINNLGMLYHDRGDLEGAEVRYREALGIQRQLFAGDHPDLAASLQNLAAVLRARRRLDESAALFEEALGMAERLYGTDNTNVGGTLQNLGLLHLDRGALEEAESCFSRALAIDRVSLGEDHPNYATNLYHLGLVKSQLREVASAEAHFRDAVERYERALGPEHPWTAFPLISLGLLLVEESRSIEADPLLARGLAIRRTALGDDHWRVADAESAYGWGLANLGRREEALPLLTGSLEALREELGSQDPRVQDAAERLRWAEEGGVAPPG